MTSKALPRLDEDDRLTPILTHLSQNFTTPDASYSSSTPSLPGADISARNVDSLSTSFPLCMQNLHRSLRRDSHLKHYGRLQYTLFLKGIGLNLEECLVFWRGGFKTITDDQFNKEYRYNVRHSYGDVGGDSNRRGNGYSPFSCQKILTEHPPGPGEAHGCPYRHFSTENLISLLRQVGVSDHQVLQGVKEDKEKTKYHLACNRYVYPIYVKCQKLNIAASLSMHTSKRSRKLEKRVYGARHSWRQSCIRTSILSAVIC
jgi:DNA primase large subunit